MKTYVIYKEVQGPGGLAYQYYLKSDGDLTTDPKEAKRYNVRTWLEFIVTVLQLVIKLFGTNFKYKRL